MKKAIIPMLVSSSIISAQAQTTWGYDQSHAKVGFSISHFGISETEGKFTKFDGTVLSDKADFSDAQIDFTIDVSSINTEDAQRDTHLKSPDFFDAVKYPSITFKGKSLKSTGKNKYKLTGDLMMHGVTKSIELDVIYKGTVVDPFKNTKAGFKITGVLDRTQFGLSWNGKLSTGNLLVGNEVTLDINIELIKK
ncbi:polyisoprenoid-binding protein [Cytophagales bacterium WSM2-2]|nr:polyisoprenoid-binding protein [Cytophagales bacterium WSM2-2]